MEASTYTLHIENPFQSCKVSGQTTPSNLTFRVWPTMARDAMGQRFESSFFLGPDAMKDLSARATVRRNQGGRVQARPATINSMDFNSYSKPVKSCPKLLSGTDAWMTMTLGNTKDTNPDLERFTAALLHQEPARGDDCDRKVEVAVPVAVPQVTHDMSIDVPLRDVIEWQRYLREEGKDFSSNPRWYKKALTTIKPKSSIVSTFSLDGDMPSTPHKIDPEMEKSSDGTDWAQVDVDVKLVEVTVTLTPNTEWEDVHDQDTA